jgi:hypothetical protein
MFVEPEMEKIPEQFKNKFADLSTLFSSAGSLPLIGARALLDINLIWFGYIADLSQWGGGGYYSFKWFLPAVASLKGGGGGGSALWKS